MIYRLKRYIGKGGKKEEPKNKKHWVQKGIETDED